MIKTFIMISKEAPLWTKNTKKTGFEFDYLDSEENDVKESRYIFFWCHID